MITKSDEYYRRGAAKAPGKSKAAAAKRTASPSKETSPTKKPKKAEKPKAPSASPAPPTRWEMKSCPSLAGHRNCTVRNIN